jgi:tetratricopeptide (TPR) repeat protein
MGMSVRELRSGKPQRAVIVLVLVMMGVMAGGVAFADMPKPNATKPEDPDYSAAVKAVKAERFAEAIPLLQGVVKRDTGSADGYNLLAYAIRRNGDPAASIPIYEQALALDPKHREAHEYIGEAYLALGNLGKAKEHLARLDKLCLLPCSAYRDLKKAVDRYEKERTQR